MSQHLPVKCDFAIIYFCPVPPGIDEYDPIVPQKRYFSGIEPKQVLFCKHQQTNFLVITEFTDSLIDQLNNYGVPIVVGMGVLEETQALKPGDNIVADMGQYAPWKFQTLTPVPSDIATRFHFACRKAQIETYTYVATVTDHVSSKFVQTQQLQLLQLIVHKFALRGMFLFI